MAAGDYWITPSYTPSYLDSTTAGEFSFKAVPGTTLTWGSTSVTYPYPYSYFPEPKAGPTDEPQPESDVSDLKQHPYWVLILQVDEEGRVLNYETPKLVLSSSEKQAHVAGARLIPDHWVDTEGLETRVLVRPL